MKKSWYELGQELMKGLREVYIRSCYHYCPRKFSIALFSGRWRKADDVKSIIELPTSIKSSCQRRHAELTPAKTSALELQDDGDRASALMITCFIQKP